jgi:hypothetical protein
LLSAIPDPTQVVTVASIAVTVAGAAVMSGSAYGTGSVVTIQPPLVQQAAAGYLGSAGGLGAGSPSSGAGGSTAVGRAEDAAERRSAGADQAAQEAEELAGQPAFVSIGSIGATSSLIDLGLTPDGSLAVPEDFMQAGWWKRGPRPGDPGPAVITGHLDSIRGPGVFAKLGLVKPGDEVTVTRKDGSQLLFIVTRVDRYPKRAFPTRKVYDDTDAAELRVITCGGNFNRGERSYEDNIVVFAKLQGSDAPTPEPV